MTGQLLFAAAFSRCANVVLPAPPQPSMPTMRTALGVARMSSTSCAYVRIAVIHTSVAHQRFSSYLAARIHVGGARRNVRSHRLSKAGLLQRHVRAALPKAAADRQGLRGSRGRRAAAARAV